MNLKATKSLPKSAQTKPKGSQCQPQGSPKTPKSHPKGHNREPKLPKDPFQEPKCDPRRQKSAKMASQCPLKGQKIMKDAPFEAPKSQQKSFPFKPANPHPPHPTRTTTHTKRRQPTRGGGVPPALSISGFTHAKRRFGVNHTFSSNSPKNAL